MASIEHRPATTAIQAAEDAHEAVRALIRLTLERPAYEHPSDLDAVIRSLQLLAEQLPQAIRQAEEWLEEERDAGRLQGTHGGEAVASVAEVETVAAELTAARVVARRLGDHLRTARAHITHIGGLGRWNR